ncbi:insulin-like growth factor 1 receptor isoform X3 [Portunus trituberculatus]|uniref:insulin-like growth factor 1 receptor isoform X3 n=1 Tax=Portunus trituberculatus TaxID=210409 RepID=UPI001E1CD591|nr:insulin-like growth factor 1 receptor isoform X3 [Portunus trituberculatus]
MNPATAADDERLRSDSSEERRDGRARRFAQLVPGKRPPVMVIVLVLMLVMMVVVVTVLVTGRNKFDHPLATTNQHGAAFGKTCGSVEVTGDQTFLEDYVSCVTIEGNLRIQLIEYNETQSLVGLPNLIQVTGYVIIYQLSYLKTLRHLLPLLAVIRGRELFHGYSLVIYGNIFLQEPNLWNLTHVLRGAVRVEKNLCSGPPNRWDLLSPSPALNVVQDYGLCVYPMCEEQRDCTNVTTAIHTYCTTHGGCYQDSQCHEECVGGCYALYDPNACVACRNYQDGHTCVPECSSSVNNKVHHLGYRCIREDECAKEPWKMEREMGPHGTERLVCVPCNDNCYGTCRGTKVTTANMGRQLRKCQHLKGNLEIMVSGGANLMQQLEENLGQVKVVTGYLKVYGCDTLFSLNFLSTLEKIGGEDLAHGRYALYVLDNEKLRELWDWEHRNHSLEIIQGMLFFQHNPSLCRELIRKLATQAQVQADRVHVSHAEDTAPCYTSDLEVRCVPLKNGRLEVLWKYHYHGRDHRFVIGYYLYYREAPEKITLYQGRDACNDNIVWKRIFREYEHDEECVVGVDNLKPYTQYAVYVDVYYIDAVKNASRSSIQYVTTQVGEPSPVRELKATSQKGTSAQFLSWREPAVRNGPLKVYEVKHGRLKLPRPRPTPEDRDVCVDSRDEPQNKTRLSLHGGEDDNKATRCCACPDSAANLSKEDRRYDHEFDIHFQTFMWQSLFCKSQSKPPAQRRNYTADEVTRNVSDITSTPVIPGTASIVAEEQNRSRQRKRRSIVHLSARIQDRTDTETSDQKREEKNNKYKEMEHDECEISTDTNSDTAEVCDVRTMTTNNTRVTLMRLSYFTQYRVWVRACHTEGSICSDWSVLDVTTPVDISIYKIKNFKVKQMKTNETKWPDTKSQANSSNKTPASPPGAAAQIGTTLLLSWDPPMVPMELILAYIIEYQLEQTPKKKICVPQQKMRHAEYRFPLQKYGSYTFHIRLRSPSGDGPPTSLTIGIKRPDVYWAVPVAFLCGGLLGICIMEVVLWVRWRKRSEAPESQTFEELLLEAGLKHLEKDFIIDSNVLQVKLDKKIGQGVFGIVYLGMLKLPAGEERQVAVKTVNEEATYQDMKHFLDEATVMQKMKSNFVVSLIGVNSCPPIYVVMEFMEYGDLKSFLLREEGATITNEKMVEMAVEAADGMAYLKANNWVHRDLAARNCMLGMVEDRLILKIGDFGLTRHVTTDYYKIKTCGLLPVRWMAPESLEYYRYTTRSDVWSYGVLLWELASGGRQPYEDKLDKEVEDFILCGKRLGPPDRGPDFFYPLMLKCWNAVPEQRPSFKRIVQRLLPMTSKKYLEYFQRVSFFHNPGSSEHEGPDDIDEGFNASSSSQEEAEAGYSGSYSSSLPPFHHLDQDSQVENDQFENESSEDDTAVEDDLVCMTPEEPYERQCSGPLPCITSHVGRLPPSSDAPHKKLLFRTSCFAET